MSCERTQKAAETKAAKLVELCNRQIGGKWKASVHQNLGWWYCAVLDDKIVIREYLHPVGSTIYSVGFFGGTPSEVSIMEQRFDSPKEAFLAQRNQVKKQMLYWQDIWLTMLDHLC